MRAPALAGIETAAKNAAARNNFFIVVTPLCAESAARRYFGRRLPKTRRPLVGRSILSKLIFGIGVYSPAALRPGSSLRRGVNTKARIVVARTASTANPRIAKGVMTVFPFSQMGRRFATDRRRAACR